MKKNLLRIFVTVLAVCTVLLGTFYAVDMSRMNNNQEVLFSTWGYDYAPPLTQQEPPILRLGDGEGNQKAVCLTGTYDWTEKGMSVCADYPHPEGREYNKENVLNFEPRDVVFIDQKAKITSVRLYRPDQYEVLEQNITFDDRSIVLDIEKGEYIMEIVVEYQQGTVNYCVKLNGSELI